MACFIVPAAEAIVTTVAAKAFQSKEKAEMNELIQEEIHEAVAEKLPFSKKMGWLNKMLWGGSALLAFEHVWHGEVSAWFPFLTAMENKEAAATMLHEMSTVGVSMAVLVTAVWGVLLLVSGTMEKKMESEESRMVTK